MIRPVFKAGLPEWVNVETTDNTDMQLYPNPVSNRLQLTLTPEWMDAHYTILNAQGQCVMSGALQHQTQLELGVESLAKGLYTLRLTHTNNEVTYQSFIKQ
jgi:hypothetical protein